jgi:hypothetical protein
LIIPEFANAVGLIGDKMLRLLEKIGCKCLMEIDDLCRGGILFNGGVVTTPKVVRNATFICLKLPTRSAKTVKEEDT